MNLIQHFEHLLQGGVVLTLKMAKAGEQIRLDIIATGKDNKSGVALPSKALLGTAKEIDDGLDEFLPKYAASVGRIETVLANADAELAAAEQQATAAARKAVAEKTKAKPAVKSTAKPTTPGKRNVSEGLINDDDADGGAGGDEGTGTDDDDDAETTLNTSGAAAVVTAPAAAEGNALSAELF